MPIPEQHAAVGSQVERAIATALKEAAAKGVSGAEVTPYLLRRVKDLTGGASLTANIQLIRHNAAIGAKIAVALVYKD